MGRRASDAETAGDPNHLTFAAPPALRSTVARFEIVQSNGGETLVLPSTGAVLGFQMRGRVRNGEHLLSTAGVTGLLATARSYSYVGHTTSLLVRFTPQGAACLGVPSSDLANHSVPLDGLMRPAAVAELTDRLLSARDHVHRIELVSRWLSDRPLAFDGAMGRALQRLHASAGNASIAAIADEIGMSERQLERRFVARVGISPKRYARLVRFEQAAAALRSGPSLTEVALAAGYYDQSHFIREFRSFAGVAPGALRPPPR